MHMYLDCIPCMISQGIFAARETGCDKERQKAVVDALAGKIPDFSLETTPPELAVDVYRIIREVTGSDDPFAAVKRASNEAALSIYPDLIERLEHSENPLLTAVQIAVLGNIIDYGADTNIDLKEEIRKILEDEAAAIAGEEERLFDLETFMAEIASAGEVLCIGDNAGEIVFDRVLMELIRSQYPDITLRYAVRGRPIINDVTMEDALAVGMDKVCEVVSSGCPAPGAVPRLCSEDFIRLMESADVIISKGQGNYEALSETEYPVFFLLRVKCSVIAMDIPAKRGDVCLFRAEA